MNAIPHGSILPEVWSNLGIPIKNRILFGMIRRNKSYKTNHMLQLFVNYELPSSRGNHQNKAQFQQMVAQSVTRSLWIEDTIYSGFIEKILTYIITHISPLIKTSQC